MTDVVTYRTEKMEQLKKLAKEKNVSISQLTGDIVNYYFEFYDLRNTKPLKASSEMISFCFSLLSESDLQKTTDLVNKEITRFVKTITTDFSLENMLKLIRNYYKYNHFEFSEFDETDHIKIACKNPMSRNWNKNAVTGLSKFLNDIGLATVVDSSDDRFHSYKISKQKSHKTIN